MLKPRLSYRLLVLQDERNWFSATLYLDTQVLMQYVNNKQSPPSESSHTSDEFWSVAGCFFYAWSCSWVPRYQDVIAHELAKY